MISRLTAVAACFAVLATVSLAFAAEARQDADATARAMAQPVRAVQLERVVITGKRTPQASL